MKTYRVKPEYYDLWQATPENDIVAEEFVLQMTHPNEWDKPLEDLLEQLEEISEPGEAREKGNKMENKKYYFCPACGEYVYRIPGYRHGDGQHDTDETPVYLLANVDDMTDDEIEQADSRRINCGCNE